MMYEVDGSGELEIPSVGKRGCEDEDDVYGGMRARGER